MEPETADPARGEGERGPQPGEKGGVHAFAGDRDRAEQAGAGPLHHVLGELAAVLKVYLFVCPDSPCRSIDLMPLRQAQGTKQM